MLKTKWISELLFVISFVMRSAHQTCTQDSRFPNIAPNSIAEKPRLRP